MSTKKTTGVGRLPDGTLIANWERPLTFAKTFYVDAARGDDAAPGTQARPFRTISRAAEILQPGQRVVIAEGVYRESIVPTRGGTGPTAMISYEAAPGAKVIVKGSAVLDQGWTASTGWRLGHPRSGKPKGTAKVYQIRLSGDLFPDGYNPFALVNVLQDRFWLDTKRLDMAPYFRRRGMLFVDGVPLKQVDLYNQLAADDGAFWVEHNGLVLHVRLPGDVAPQGHLIEATTCEQVFAPRDRFLGYIRVQGITFAHAGNGFPVPQRGLVSTSRGHHWIIEDCTIEWANSVGLDVGKECWHAPDPDIRGHHRIRRNVIRHCGMCGIAGLSTDNMIVEDNLLEHIGFQDAEYMYESAGAKFHHSRNLLFRRNLVRNHKSACGLWLDCGHENCRVTANAFLDIASITGGIHLEGNHDENQVDNNIVIGMHAVPQIDGTPGNGGKGIYIQGTDRTIIAHNLMLDCDCFGFRCDVVPNRIIGPRGGTARKNQVLRNVFLRTGRSAVEFENEHNFSDGNVFINQPGGFLRIDKPPYPELLDLATWREFHGWDMNGVAVKGKACTQDGQVTIEIEEAVPKAKPAGKAVDVDFAGERVTNSRPAGPFAVLPGKHGLDPRRVGRS